MVDNLVPLPSLLSKWQDDFRAIFRPDRHFESGERYGARLHGQSVSPPLADIHTYMTLFYLEFTE